MLLAALILAEYNPLEAAFESGKTRLTEVSDSTRTRSIPIKLYVPSSPGAWPVILFSHGLGGSREGSVFLGKHWSARGYFCVFLQHPGSDESVWRDVPIRERMAAMRKAASGAEFRSRILDVDRVLDALESWNEAGAWKGLLALDKIGLAGHSFGAVTTQAVSGQSFPGVANFTDPRIRAALPMSPSSPAIGSAESAFGKVDIPWLLMTGTRDDSVISNTKADDRLAVFQALPPGSKYELVLDGAEHSVFTDRALPGDRSPRNPKHHEAILALSTAFWDAYLGGRTEAKRYLAGRPPVLDQADSFKAK